GVQLPVVTIENQSGTREIVNHLIEVHNRRRIVFLRGPEGHEDSEWREKGYREALKAHAIPFDPALVARGGFNRDEARQALEQLLLEGMGFDAIFAGDDDASVGVLLGLRQAGIQVPEAIAVAGFDDQVFSATLVPPLTTVRAPTEQVGVEAVRQLVGIIRGESVEPRL
ncbi:MAG TPA: LacI family transcriptional regulator, partial [Syntrophobacteraceae bacterium]|nr:LacI family transcriptional regulator [Syntrophobacteraceae bacterium]